MRKTSAPKSKRSSQNATINIDSSSLALQQGAPARAKRSLFDKIKHCEQGSNKAASQNATINIDSSSLALQQGAPAVSKRSLLNINEHCEQGSNKAASQNATINIDSSSLALQQGAPAVSKRSLLNINEHCEQGSNKAASQNAKSLFRGKWKTTLLIATTLWQISTVQAAQTAVYYKAADLPSQEVRAVTATTTSCPSVINVPGSGNCTLCGVIQALAAMHCKNTEMIDYVLKNIVYAVDDLIQSTIMPKNKSLLQSNQDVNNAVSTTSSNLTSYYLAGLDVKEKENLSLTKIIAEDISGKAPQYDNYSQYVFNLANKNADTAIMNTDTLLGPLQYDERQKNDAQTLIRTVETISQLPDIIRISNKFKIPYSTDPNKSTTLIDLTDKSSIAKLFPSGEEKPTIKTTNLLEKLNTKPEYRQYVLKYRSAILSRTMMLNNLLKIYQERLAPSNKTSTNDKSQAQLDYDSATWRLDPKNGYYEKMQTASPTVVGRETLFLLAEIRHELYQMRQQNERMIALQSLLGLQMADINKMTGDTQTKQVAKLIYCEVVDPSPCQQKSTTESSAIPSSSSITELQAASPK